MEISVASVRLQRVLTVSLDLPESEFGWLSSSPRVGYTLQVRCSQDRGDETPHLEQHKHVWLVSGRARATERYPPKLVAAVQKAIRAQLQQDRNVSMHALEAGIGPHVEDLEILAEVGGWAPNEDEEDEADLPRAYDVFVGTQIDPPNDYKL